MADVRQPLATRAALEEESGLRASGDSALADLVALEAAARAAADDLRALLDDPRFTDPRPPTGGAGGVLSGTFPDPGFAVDMAEQSELQTEITNRAADVDAEESARIAADAAHAALTNNPHAVTKAQVGLANVTNDAQETPSGAQAKVDAAIAALLDSAPGALDTLNELAAALGDDPNFATTLTNALALKAPIASPTFTGAVTLPGDPGAALVAAPKQYVDAQAAAVQAAAVLLAGAQTITGKKTFGDAAAATVLAASRVNGDTVDRLAWKVGGNLEWSSGAAAADAILSRVTRGLNLAGKLEVFAQNAGDVAGVLRGFTGQTGDIFQAQDPAGAVMARITSLGRVNLGSQVSGAGVVIGDPNAAPSGLGSNVGLDVYADFNAIATALAYVNRHVGSNAGIGMVWGMADSAGTQKRGMQLRVQKVGTWSSADVNSQNALFSIRLLKNGVDTEVATLSSSGVLGLTFVSASSGIATPSFADLSGTGPYLDMTAARAAFLNRTTVTNIPLVSRGMAAQTGNLQEWQDSAGVPGMGVDSARRLRWVAAGLVQTTVGAAGAGSALPATPREYVHVVTPTGLGVIPVYAAA